MSVPPAVAGGLALTTEATENTEEDPRQPARTARGVAEARTAKLRMENGEWRTDDPLKKPER
ncbi:MAG: hypothetical protein K1X52_08600 [Pyrinomonadaceae bacterium]|nr:hypothetical protein [Pyrinomonadaceae bacterium]